jgi:hypothetical protein
MATQTTTQRKAAARKAAATRKRNAARRKTSARRAAATRVQAETSTLGVVQAQAERAVLIPVGAALVARDNLVEAARPFTNRQTAERELRKFERRGTTARNRAQRQVKRTRTRVERELRQRRNQATRLVRRNRREVGRQVKSTRREVERFGDDLQSGAEDVARRVQDQVSLA